MELVPIITQILTIVASIFILVLLISFIASKVRKKEKDQNLQNNSYGRGVAHVKIKADKGKYFGGSYNSVNSLSNPKEIKVIKRSTVQKTYATNSRYKTNSYLQNNRFTVINKIDPIKPRAIETDEYGFKVYADNEITRSFYLPN